MWVGNAKPNAQIANRGLKNKPIAVDFVNSRNSHAVAVTGHPRWSFQSSSSVRTQEG